MVFGKCWKLLLFVVKFKISIISILCKAITYIVYTHYKKFTKFSHTSHNLNKYLVTLFFLRNQWFSCLFLSPMPCPLFKQSMMGSKVVTGELEHIIWNIRKVSSLFSWCSFQHLKREGNKIAHELARVARNSGATQVWKRSIPSLIEHLILEDLCL